MTRSGGFERASRIGHGRAVVEAMAERATFHVPAEAVEDASWLVDKVRPRSDLARPEGAERIDAAIAVDGSYVSVEARPGLPSVRYGYVQVGAVFLDLDRLDEQRDVRFVDPVALAEAKRSSIVSLSFPTAGAYLREGISTARSWREALDRTFRTKKVERWTLLELLMLLHGSPDAPVSTVPVKCQRCSTGADVPAAGAGCPTCGEELFATDVLRIHEEVLDEGTNEAALGRLMSVIELLVLLGLATLLWERERSTLLARTLLILDGPLGVFGTPAKLRGRALEYVQHMTATTPGSAPFICGVEKSSAFVDYAHAVSRHDVLERGDLMVVDQDVLGRITNAENVAAYGENTYWGRKFFYRALDGRVLVLTVPPADGAPYDKHGGQPEPGSYPSLSAIIDVVDRTGSSMYEDGIIPVALAHGAAAYPIGVGTDVLELVARRRLGLEDDDAADPWD